MSGPGDPRRRPKTPASARQIYGRVRRGRTTGTGIGLSFAPDMATDHSDTQSAPATCGAGLAEHATVPSKLAVMFEGLAETLELHRRMLVLEDASSRQEDDVYRDLAGRWREIARHVSEAASRMAAQRSLPMGAHDESAWSEDHVRAFEKYVTAQAEVLAELSVAAPRDEEMLAQIKAANG